MIELREYLDANGRSPFRAWRLDLNDIAHAKIMRALQRLELGNTSNVKGVGEGVSELKIDFGPGYRVYFGHEGASLVILLGGGTKKRQEADIAKAHERWSDYKRRR